MDVIHQRCAGIDISKADVKVCVRVPGPGTRRRTEVRTFSSMTAGLLAMRDWLMSEQVTLVGMEATGAYWKPIFYLLESDVECWLLNARHMKTVPGRKTDLLTELSASSPRGCVPGGIRLARFAAREQRCGCAAGVVRAGGAAAGFVGGDGRAVRAVSAC
jgi:hypothetical protein